MAIIAISRLQGEIVVITTLPELGELPQKNASQVKNKWGDVVRLVHQMGSVAITNHSTVEMVLLDADTYRKLSESLQAAKLREASVLDELSSRFDMRLATLQQPDTGLKVGNLMNAKGKLKQRPKAGASY